MVWKVDHSHKLTFICDNPEKINIKNKSCTNTLTLTKASIRFSQVTVTILLLLNVPIFPTKLKFTTPKNSEYSTEPTSFGLKSDDKTPQNAKETDKSSVQPLLVSNIARTSVKANKSFAL